MQKTGQEKQQHLRKIQIYVATSSMAMVLIVVVAAIISNFLIPQSCETIYRTCLGNAEAKRDAEYIECTNRTVKKHVQCRSNVNIDFFPKQEGCIRAREACQREKRQEILRSME